MSSSSSPTDAQKSYVDSFFELIKTFFQLNFYELIKTFFKRFGWTLVFTLIILYNLWPFVNSYISKLSFDHSQRPERRKVLDEAVLKVRERQQEDYRQLLREQQFQNVKNVKSE